MWLTRWRPILHLTTSSVMLRSTKNREPVHVGRRPPQYSLPIRLSKLGDIQRWEDWTLIF